MLCAVAERTLAMDEGGKGCKPEWFGPSSKAKRRKENVPHEMKRLQNNGIDFSIDSILVRFHDSPHRIGNYRRNREPRQEVFRNPSLRVAN